MMQRVVVCTLLCAFGLAADTLVLRSGKVVEGTYLGGDSRTVRMLVNDASSSFSVSDISEIRFGSAPAPTAAPKQRSQILRPEPETPAATAAPRRQSSAMTTTASAEVPAGTALVIRMIDDVDSERDTVGQTFRASVDEAVSVDGRIVIPRGADVTAKLVDDKQAGRLSGRTELTLDLQSITVNGRTTDVLTQEITQQSESRTRQSTTRVGGGAALGAIIGAIAGGGKGAAIGAVTGAAAGGAVQVLTKGPRVRIPSETRLTFTLQQPLKI